MTREARDSNALDTILNGLRSLPLPLVVLDANGHTIHENAAYCSELGTGAIARELAVALIGGRASALHAALRGICRVLPVGPTLPVNPAILGAVRAQPGSRDAGANRAPARLDGVRVLVVDDEPDARELVAIVLREAGAETTEASSAAAALAAIDRAAHDVLISDIAMPDEDGYSFMHTLRTRERSAGGALPAVALSAFTRAEDVQRSHEAGFDRHLAKPVDPLELVTAVRQLARASDERPRALA